MLKLPECFINDVPDNQPNVQVYELQAANQSINQFIWKNAGYTSETKVHTAGRHAWSYKHY